MVGLLLLVIALIVYGSLYPWQFDFNRPHDAVWLLFHNWPISWDRLVARDAVLNLLLYAPLGVTAFLALRGRRHARPAVLVAAVALGFALSASMELLQAYDDHRDTSLLDLTMNTAGTAGGALLALLFEPAVAELARRRARVWEASAALLAVCWTVFQFYPFMPYFGTYRLRVALARPWHFGSVSALEIWCGAAEWFALALALEAMLGRLRTGWLAAVMLVMPLRYFIVTRALGWNDLLAALLALALWSGIPRRQRLRAGPGMILSAVLLRELAPFHWSAEPAPFQWIPFVPTLESERQSAVVILARKAFQRTA